MRTGSHSFFAASRILPKRFRIAATAVYAFCRVADDAVDEMPHGASIEIVMAYLHERLEAIYRNEPFCIDADIAFAAVVQEYAIPKEIPMALLEGFQWDAAGRRYETLEEVYEYSARVAGTVGAMMTLVMGGRSAKTVARACELGVAMQLTNIARDVGEDARCARLYLPLQWLRQAGIEPEQFLETPAYTPALGRVVQRLLKAADQLYLRAETGIASLPRDCRASIMAARLIYADIGRMVGKNNFDSITRRGVTGKARKWWLISRALGAGAIAPQKDFLLKPLPQIQFLVNTLRPGEEDAVRPDLLLPVLELLERNHRQRLSRS
jgi:15-cis-phytoene synthase